MHLMCQAAGSVAKKLCSLCRGTRNTALGCPQTPLPASPASGVEPCQEATSRGVYSLFQGNPFARLALGLRPPTQLMLHSPRLRVPEAALPLLRAGLRPGLCSTWESGNHAGPSEETQVSAFHAPPRLPSPMPWQHNYRRLPPLEPFPRAAERNTISGFPNYKRP